MNNLIVIGGKKGTGKDVVVSVINYLVWKDAVKKGLNRPFDLTLEDFLKNKAENIYEIVRFADPIKDSVCRLIGCTREQLEDRDFKEKELGPEWWYYTNTLFYTKDKVLVPYIGASESIKNNKNWYLIKHTPRSLMQTIGTEAGRNIIHPNVWCLALFNKYVKEWNGKTYYEHGTEKEVPEFTYPNWIIPDLRFPNEAIAIKIRDGLFIRVNRDIHLRYPDLWEQYKNTNNITCKKDFINWIAINEPDIYKSITHESETALDNYKGWHYNVNNNGTIEDLLKIIEEILIKEKIIR